MTHTRPWALISVTDKSNIVELAQSLVRHGFKILSTGGSAKVLRAGGIEVKDVAEFAGSPEIMNGRVKTLHPVIHGGILMDRNDENHVREAKENGIEPIDMVIVNLYDFEGLAQNHKLPLEKAIEHIDIGGPTMLRAAAKNFSHTTPVIDPKDYGEIITELNEKNSLSQNLRLKLAAKTFAKIAQYDARIASYFSKDTNTAEASSSLNLASNLGFESVNELRYGENPHQSAGFYTHGSLPSGLQHAKVLSGKSLSYNNLLDVDAASAIVREFPDKKAVAIIKHTNPCGVSVSEILPLKEIFHNALKCDPKSAFGGIVAVNVKVDAEAAKEMAQIFLECIAAPSFSKEAHEIFARKKNLRILELPFLEECSLDDSELVRSVQGGFLVQSRDNSRPNPLKWQVVTEKVPHKSLSADLVFAQTICKHVKSNAIVVAKNESTVAIGAGQMSRIDAAKIAFEKAKESGHSTVGSALASDAFFPFRDTIDFAARHEIAGVIQPGGSKRDNESIAAANENNLTMVLTGVRHFKH